MNELGVCSPELWEVMEFGEEAAPALRGAPWTSVQNLTPSILRNTEVTHSHTHISVQVFC